MTCPYITSLGRPCGRPSDDHCDFHAVLREMETMSYYELGKALSETVAAHLKLEPAQIMSLYLDAERVAVEYAELTPEAMTHTVVHLDPETGADLGRIVVKSEPR